jgi:HTH-type transcriptional regulator/antitoxin HigA
MFPRLVKTEAQYREYLEEIERLCDLDPEPNSEDGERLALLALLIKDYEKERASLPLPSPVDAILFRMEAQGLKQKDLVPYIGSKSHVSEILSGKRKLTINMVRALSKGLGIPSSALLVDSENQKLEENETDWSRFPINTMAKRGWLSVPQGASPEDSVNAIKEFFNKVGGQGIGPAYCRRTMHLGGEVKTDIYALNAWLARVLVRSRDLSPDKDQSFRKKDKRDFLKSVAQLSWLEEGPIIAQEYLQQSGIALIIEPHLPKTRLDGAALLDSNGAPVIGMTLRYDRLDNFWFTLLHELAHVLLHLQSKQEAFIDNTEHDPDGERKEIEANNYAQEALIPRSIWRRSDAYRSQRVEDIERLAKDLKIHPAIVAGRIQRETGNYKRFAKLIGHKQVSRQFYREGKTNKF